MSAPRFDGSQGMHVSLPTHLTTRLADAAKFSLRLGWKPNLTKLNNSEFAEDPHESGVFRQAAGKSQFGFARTPSIWDG